MIGKTNAFSGGGGTPPPTGTITINANGTYDVTTYATANVQVPDSSDAGYALAPNRYGEKVIFLVDYILVDNTYGKTAQLISS